MQFLATILFVTDIKKSTDFYSNLLEQKVLYDFNECITFKSGLSLQLKTNYKNSLSNEIRISSKSNNSALYFESDKLSESLIKFKASDTVIVHQIEQQPWGQQIFRINDPDGHLIEIGEPIESTIIRLIDSGMTEENINLKTKMPLSSIAAVKKRNRLK